MEQSAIATRDHRTSIPEQRFDSVAGRGRLPFVAGNMIDTEDHLRDFLLGCPRPMSVKGLQHPAQSRPPLPGQSRIRRNRTAMQSRK